MYKLYTIPYPITCPPEYDKALGIEIDRLYKEYEESNGERSPAWFWLELAKFLDAANHGEVEFYRPGPSLEEACHNAEQSDDLFPFA